MARASFAERVSRNPARYGERIPVNTPTHVAGTLRFAAGPLVTMIQSFDVWGSTLPRIEIYGSEGSMVVPDPNTFGGPIMVRRADEREWQSLNPLFRPVENSRGLGVLDLADAVRTGATPRCDGTVGLHVVDVMQGLLESGDEGRHVAMTTRPERPAAMPLERR
jgi:predicted dehydrogenase